MKDFVLKISGFLGFCIGVAAVAGVAAFPHRSVLNAVLAALSLVLLSVFFTVHFETLKTFSRKRSTQMGMNSIVMVLSFVFIIVVFNLMVGQFYVRKDYSSTGRYTLAPQTVKIVSGLNRVVRITVFSQENTSAFRRVSELLESYRYLNANIVYTVRDLDREPLLAKEYGVTRYNSTVVQAGGTPSVVPGSDEQTITNAIISVTRTTRKKIYFVTGHGERDILNQGRAGMSRAAAALNEAGSLSVILPLPSVDAVPADAAVVVVAGPQKPFSRQDASKLVRFLSQGGKVLAFLDSGYDAGPITGTAGIEVGQGLIADPSSNLGGGNQEVPLVSHYPDSPVTHNFRLSTVYPGASPLLLQKQKEYDYITIVASAPSSRVVKQGRIIDRAGNYPIAAAAGSKNGRDTLLVFGDSDFVSNALFPVEGNSNLFLNCVNWLSEEAELISVAARKDEFIPLYLTGDQSTFLLYLFVFGLPAAVVGAGLSVWWKRGRL